MGRELNPSIGSFDIKTHNELRPGLILWMLVDISMACEQWCRLGGRLTASMVLVVMFHSFYVTDALYNESAIYTTMDVTTGEGFLLCFSIFPSISSLLVRWRSSADALHVLA
jgi:delta14-sterol reductase